MKRTILTGSIDRSFFTALFMSFALISIAILVLLIEHQVAEAQDEQPCSLRDYWPTPTLARPVSRNGVKEVRSRDITLLRKEAFEFLTNTVPITIYGGECLCLSSSERELANLKVDDEILIHVTHADGLSEAWKYDFYNSNTGGIKAALPQDITRLFAPGPNVANFSLRDTQPISYSASPVWLLVWRRPFPVISNPKTDQALSLAPGQSVELSATLKSDGIPGTANMESAWAVNIKRTDGKLVKDLQMTVFGDRAIGSFTPEPPEQQSVQVSFNVRATVRHQGVKYDTVSEPVSFIIRTRPGASLTVDSDDFGKGFKISDLSPITATAKVRGSDQVQITADVAELPWLRVRVEPSTIRSGDTSIRFIPELKGSEEPEGGRVYTGTLTLKTNSEVEIVPAQVPIKLELLKREISHTLRNADFGTVDNWDSLARTYPITFTVSSLLPSETPFEARLVDGNLKDNERVRLVLSPSSVPSRGVTVTSLALVPIGSASWNDLFQGITIQGNVILSGGPGVLVEPKEPVPFYLRVRSIWENALQGMVMLAGYGLGTITISFILLALAEVGWFGWRYVGGAIPNGTLQFVKERENSFSDVTVRARTLADFQDWRHRVFGILIADRPAPPYYNNRLDKTLGKFLELFLRPAEAKPDLSVPGDLQTIRRSHHGNPSESMPEQSDGQEVATHRTVEMSRRVRLFGRGNTLQLVNIDDRFPVILKQEGRSRPHLRSGESADLEHNDVIRLQGVNYRYRRSGMST